MSGVGPVMCPRCDKNDQIRKVSSVVEEGTASSASGMWTGGAFPAPYPNIVTSTGLAQRLQMPSPPVPGTSPGYESAFGCGAAIVLTVLVGIVSAFAHIGGLVDGAAIIFFFGWIGWVVFVVNRNSEEKAQIAKIMKTWPAKVRAWNDLYYCYRDDVVFPGGDPSRAVPADEMASLLTV